MRHSPVSTRLFGLVAVFCFRWLFGLDLPWLGHFGLRGNVDAVMVWL